MDRSERFYKIKTLRAGGAAGTEGEEAIHRRHGMISDRGPYAHNA
jgi:hypothetical protein